MRLDCYLPHSLLPSSLLLSASLALAIGTSACGEDIVWPAPERLDSVNLITSSFGPRQRGSAENPRYDFHRGLDLPAVFGSPVRAMLAGTVRIAGDDEDYSEDTIQLVHCRDEEPPADLLEDPEDCNSLYYTHYGHLSEILVTSGSRVEQGEVIGRVGAGSSGYETLHFEIRAGDRHKENAIHPLLMLSYENEGPPALTIDEVDASDPDAIEVAVTVTVPASQPDVNRVEVELYDLDSGEVLSQQYYDYMGWNEVYSENDMDTALFNGVLIEPEEFDRTSSEDIIHFRFLELSSSLSPDQYGDQYGVVARVFDIDGECAQAKW